jgi:PIN domain nuclease of toxin-antitoxin system
MNYLLDTHTLIWFSEYNDLLTKKIREIIENKENRIFVSIASLWEMAIKISFNKLELNDDFKKFIRNMILQDINILNISTNHILILKDLEYKHRDPFDRIIISQGLKEGLTIITHDRVFEEYKVKALIY